MLPLFNSNHRIIIKASRNKEENDLHKLCSSKKKHNMRMGIRNHDVTSRKKMHYKFIVPPPIYMQEAIITNEKTP